MEPPKVVPRVPEDYFCPVVLPLLTETVREASEATQPIRRPRLLRSSIEVQTRSGSGSPATGTTSTPTTFSGRVARFAFLRAAIDLDGLREAREPIMQSPVHPTFRSLLKARNRGRRNGRNSLASIRRSDRGAVRRESIRCDPERRPRRDMAKTLNESICGLLIALSHRDIQDQLCCDARPTESDLPTSLSLLTALRPCGVSYGDTL